MIRLLMWLLLGYVVFLIFKGRSGKREIPKESSGGGDETYQDPVCGVYVAEDDAVVGKLDGKRIHFCSMACLEKFQEQVTHKE